MDGAALHGTALALAAPSSTVLAAAGLAKPDHAVPASALLATAQQPLGSCLTALAHAAVTSSLVAAVRQGLVEVRDGGAAVLRLIAAAYHGLVGIGQAQPAKVVQRAVAQHDSQQQLRQEAEPGGDPAAPCESHVTAGAQGSQAKAP